MNSLRTGDNTINFTNIAALIDTVCFKWEFFDKFKNVIVASRKVVSFMFFFFDMKITN